MKLVDLGVGSDARPSGRGELGKLRCHWQKQSGRALWAWALAAARMHEHLGQGNQGSISEGAGRHDMRGFDAQCWEKVGGKTQTYIIII